MKLADDGLARKISNMELNMSPVLLYCEVGISLSSRLLSKNLKIKIYKTIILPVVLYGCET